jgi:hypothetical protein
MDLFSFFDVDDQGDGALENQDVIAKASRPQLNPKQQGQRKGRSAGDADRVRVRCALADLGKHVAACLDGFKQCGQCWYGKMHAKWRSRFPWLDSATCDGVWGAGCKLCARAGAQSSFAAYAVNSRICLQAQNLKHHSATKQHIRAVQLSLNMQPAADPKAMPSESNLQKVLEHRLAGQSLRSGLPGVAAGSKLKRMQWCLAESKRDMHREFLAKASSVALHYDESLGNLSVFFTASNAHLKVRQGLMAVLPSGNGSADIALRVKRAVTIMCTRGLGAPPRRHVAEVQDPKVDCELRDSIIQKVELLNADAAADEQRASRLLQDGIMVNAKLKRKDVTHAARRTSQPLQ